MYFCICESQGNKPIFQAKLNSFYPHTSASEVAHEPVMGMSFDSSDISIDNPELFNAFCKLFVVHQRNSTKYIDTLLELWFKLPPLRGDWHWGIWNDKY